MAECFQISLLDNVATLLADAEPGSVTIRGEAEQQAIHLAQPVRIAHKVALRAMEKGAPVVKYGVPIGEATQSIAPGEWVHLHNCRSFYDDGSSHLNLETGAREEMPYV